MASVPTIDEEDDYEISYADLVTAEDIAAEEGFALSPKVIAYYQKKDRELMGKATKASSPYEMVELEEINLIAKHGKVIVPEALQDSMADNYHELLQHPGMTRMEATIRHVFDWPGLRERVEEHCHTCEICQIRGDNSMEACKR